MQGFLTPLRKKWLQSLFQRKRVILCVCLREAEAPSERYSIREVTLNSDGVVVGIADKALSPKAASSSDLREKIAKLSAEATDAPITCGETHRAFTRAHLNDWLNVIGTPVLKIIEE